jgi:hypothetical protein
MKTQTQTIEKTTICEMSIMGAAGDTKVTWDRNLRTDVENARRMFRDLKAKGYAAFNVQKLGGKGEQIFSFDEAAENVIMVPPLAGG